MRSFTVIFSPHLDDAIFSLGSSLAAGLLGKVKIITIYSRSRYTITGLEDKYLVSLRRIKEDQTAMSKINAVTDYWGFDDSSIKSKYRKDASDFNIQINPCSDPSYKSVYNRIKCEICKNKTALFLAPLGLGGHIEHRLIRDVLLSMSHLTAHSLFYEDGTYYDGKSIKIKTLANEHHLDQVLTLNALPFETKKNLVMIYKSQVDDTIIQNLLVSYLANRGERVWGKESSISFLKNILGIR